MADLSTYGGNAVLDGTPVPATLYVQLHDGDPTVDGDQNVAQTPGRRSFTRNAAVNARAESNVAVLWSGVGVAEFVTHLTLWDTATGGNCWFVHFLDAPEEVLAGGDVQAQAGEIALTSRLYGTV